MNSGTIIEHASGTSNIATNSGLVRNLNKGTFSIGTNTGVLTTEPGGAGVSISASPSLTIAQGQTATLTASGATSYTWSTGQTSPAISVSVTGTYSVTGILGSCSSVTSVVVNVTPAPDLTPILTLRPLITYGNQPVTLVVDVVELKGTPTSSNTKISVLVSKDPSLSLNFNNGASSVNGKSVQNSQWSFVDDPNSSFYQLTTSAVIGGSQKLSFGLEGSVKPGGSSGSLTVSAVIVGGSGGELKTTNNTAAGKLDYFITVAP